MAASFSHGFDLASLKAGMAPCFVMNVSPEFVGTIHIFLGPFRGNPIGLYLRKDGDSCAISPTISPWDRVVGVGETANKAAADFDAKWKAGDVAAAMYSGPHWEGGIKPEKPKPPPKPPAPASPEPPDPASSKPPPPASPKPPDPSDPSRSPSPDSSSPMASGDPSHQAERD